MSERRRRIANQARTDRNKTELATRLANQSQRVANTYQHIEDTVLRIIRWFSTLIDRTLFNRKYSKYVSLLLAVALYLIVNANSSNSLNMSTLKTSKDINDVQLTAKYNSDTFELSGLPSEANITISGDASSVTAASNTKGVVVADLEGLTEGTHNIKLKTEGFGDNVTIRIDPSNVQVTLKKKTTQQYDLSYDFINQDKMESIYSVGVPNFEYTKVNVRASKDTLDTIAFVKALIDVSGQSVDFEQEAALVAYDAKGQPVNADIVPNTVKVTVPVTSPNKTVPIEVEISGEVPNGKSIESVAIDQQTVTIYGTESVLGQIDKVVVTLNASTITRDNSTILRPITLPTGVNSSNTNQITMNVILGETETRQIDGVKINYRNNVNNYKANQPDNKTTTSVVVAGTASNIENVVADDIVVFVDMKDAKPGLQDFTLNVEQPSTGFVRYTLVEPTYTLNVLGETNADQESGDGGNTDE